MIPPHRHKHDEHNESWLMSYADMITLLMCFFIVFVSVSEPKNDKFSEITQGLASRFGSVQTSTPFAGVFESMQSIIESNKIYRDVVLEKGERSLTMELSSQSFYKPDTADLDEKKIQVLSEMVDTLKKIDYMDYRITIENYTSDAPTNTALYPSNWELSSARSARFARFLIDHGIDANRLKAVAYGDTKPKVPNEDGSGKPIPENRANNQRMVIKIERAY